MDLLRSAEIAVRDCLGIKPGENVLVITDEPCRNIGQALWTKAKELRAEAMLMEIIPRSVNGEEPPDVVAVALKKCDVFIIPTSKSLTHTKARKNACQAGARGATLPGITEDMMIRTLNADYKEIAKRSHNIAEILNKGREVKVITPSGTDITFSVKGRVGHPDTGLYLKPGEFGNLPAGESYIAPIEGTAKGTIVVDGAIGYIISEPVKIRVEDGMAVEITGGGADELDKKIREIGEEARNIAEFGIGTNDKAILTGNVLEDEKVMGTVHLALGNNLHFGGKVDVPFHQDGILLNPTVYIDGKIIMEDGNLLV